MKNLRLRNIVIFLVGIIGIFCISSYFIPRLLAGDTVVNDLRIQGSANGQIITLTIDDSNDMDTKIVVPIPEGVSYTKFEGGNSAVTEDTVNHQLIIDWIEGKTKQTIITLEASKEGVYDFVASTVRENQPVSSEIATIQVPNLYSDGQNTADISSSSENQDVEKGDIPSEDKLKENIPDSVEPKNTFNLTKNSISCTLSRAYDADSAPSEEDLTSFYDNSTASIDITLKNEENVALNGKIIIDLPHFIYQNAVEKDEGSNALQSAKPIDNTGFLKDSQNKAVEYLYDNQTGQLIIPDVEIQPGQDITYKMFSVVIGATNDDDISKTFTIPVTFESTDTTSITLSPQIVIYNFGQTNNVKNLSAADEKGNEFLKNENGEYEIPSEAEKLNFVGSYTLMNEFSGQPIISNVYDSSDTSISDGIFNEMFWEDTQGGFEALNAVANRTGDIIEANDNVLILSYPQIPKFWSWFQDAPSSAVYRSVGAQAQESQLNFTADTSNWEYDKVYGINFGYRRNSISSDEMKKTTRESYKFVRKRPNPEVHQSITLKNMTAEDNENYIGDKLLYSLSIENDVSDSAMTKTTNTIYVPKELNVDKNTIKVFDRDGNKIENVDIQYTSTDNSGIIKVTGKAVELSGKNSITVQYKALPQASGTFETRSEVVYSDSYGNQQETSQATNTIEVKNIDPWNNDFDLRPEDTTKFDTTNSDYPALTTLTKNEKTPMIYKVKNTRAPRDETLTQFDLWLTDVNWKDDFTVDKSSFYIKKSTTSEWEKVAENKIDDTTSIGDKPSYTIKDLDLKLAKGETIEIKFSITAKSAIAIKKNAIAAQGTIKESGSLSSLNSLVVKNGELRFENVPDIMSFEDSKISNRTVESSRKDKDWKITVEDTRLEKKPWRVTTKLLTPFKDTTGADLQSDILLFRKAGQEDQWINNTSETDVYDGTSTKEDYYDVSWTSNEGPLIQVAPGVVKVGQYKGVMQWSLIDAPA